MKKNLPLHVLDNFIFLFLHCTSGDVSPYIIKDDSSEVDFRTAKPTRTNPYQWKN